jgi:hypothetical protein
VLPHTRRRRATFLSGRGMFARPWTELATESGVVLLGRLVETFDKILPPWGRRVPRGLGIAHKEELSILAFL